MSEKILIDKAYAICPKCKTEHNEANKFCPKCGSPLEKIYKQDEIVVPDICPYCKKKIEKNYKYCIGCGTKVEPVQTLPNAKSGIAINKTEYNNNLFIYNEEIMLENIIKDELLKHPDCKNKTLFDIEIKKIVMSVLLSIIIIILISLFAAFRINLFTISFILFLSIYIYYNITKKLDIKLYLLKQVKLRPDEKINYIVSSLLSSSKEKTPFLITRISILLIGILIPLIVFANPHMIYEKVDNGYNLRYYTLGLIKRNKKIVIPEKYKNENVIGIRGDVFKNEIFLEEVIIPDSVKEIRGGAFNGCINLKKVKLPSNLKEIHGLTFKNCKELESIEIPDSVEEIGGEAFMYCKKLKNIDLPSRITEVHGSTFEECTSLTTIDIPEGVKRIGGSAFRNCTNLKEVKIPTTVKEIGSSAFRNTRIENICIPKSAYVNERAFKETSAKIAYYENNCIYSSNTYDAYNNFNYGEDY